MDVVVVDTAGIIPGLEAVWAAVIGFTLNFGAHASELMRSGIERVGGSGKASIILIASHCFAGYIFKA